MASQADIRAIKEAVSTFREAGEFLAKTLERVSEQPETFPVKEHRRAYGMAYRKPPGHTKAPTRKKSYVMEERHIAMIQAYAHEHRLELKDVIYAMCEEFFEG